MKFINSIKTFIKSLLGSTGDVSSNRFLAIFVICPAMIFAVFFNYDIEYIYVLSGLITVLLTGNVITKHINKNKKNDDNFEDVG